MSAEQHILITGGAGFIGSHLCEHMLRRGVAVTVVDDFSTGCRANLNDAIELGCRVVEMDVAQLREAASAFSDVTGIVHLAATVGVSRVVENPLAMIRNNLATSEAVVDVSRAISCPLLMASSSEVYGPSLASEALSESNALTVGPPDEPRWGYALTKALDEQLALAAHREHGLDVRVVRFFNVIGPRQVGDYGMVIPRMVAAAMAHKPVTVFGDGSQTRCFCDVADVVACLDELLFLSDASGAVINLGRDEEIRIDELARRVIKITGSDSEIQYVSYEQVPQRRGEPQRRRPDLTKLHGLVAWRPQIELDASIERIWQWMQRQGSE